MSDALIAREKFAEFQVAQQAQVDAQRKADTIALARYRVGYSSYFNVIDADRDLFNAELSLSAAHLNTLLSPWCSSTAPSAADGRLAAGQ